MLGISMLFGASKLIHVSVLWSGTNSLKPPKVKERSLGGELNR